MERIFIKRLISTPNSGHNETLVAKLKTDPWPLPLFFRAGVSLEVMNISNIKGTLAVDTFYTKR